MKILVTGAAGLAGQGVIRAYEASNAVERTVALVRKPSNAGPGREEIVTEEGSGRSLTRRCTSSLWNWPHKPDLGPGRRRRPL